MLDASFTMELGEPAALSKCKFILTHPRAETNEAAAHIERVKSVLKCYKVRFKT